MRNKKLSKNLIITYSIAAVVLILCAVGVVWLQTLKPDVKARAEAPVRAATAEAAFAAAGPAVPVQPDAAGDIILQDLGIALPLAPELTAQGGLVGVPGADPGRPSKSIAFTTKDLAARNRNCDGTKGWIGIITRYEGTAGEMGEHNHVHGSTTFDFPGFHISFQTVTSSCVASTPGYAPEELGKETVAAQKLFQMMLAARAL